MDTVFKRATFVYGISSSLISFACSLMMFHFLGVLRHLVDLLRPIL